MAPETRRPGLTLRRFFAIGIATTLLLLGLVAITNIAVNPLMLYRGGDSVVSGIVHDRYGDYMRLAKPHAISDLDPTGVVLGNSRALYGFDPTDPLFGARGYNAAIAGGGPLVMRDMLWHTLAVASPATILLVVDSVTSLAWDNLAFRAAVPGQDLGEFVSLAATIDGGGDPVLHWLEGQGLAISALQTRLSYDTVMRALGARRGGGDYLRDGQRPADYGDPEVARYGQRAMFQGFIDRQRRAPPGAARADAPVDEGTLAALEQSVRHAYEDDPGRRVIVVFDPIHASVYWAGQEHHLFERVTAAVDAVARALDVASGGRAEVWDCSGYSPLMAEPIPPATSRTHDMRWWWDGGHYTAATGAAILDEIAGRSHSGLCSRAAPDGMAALDARRAGDLPLVLAAGEAAVGADAGAAANPAVVTPDE